MTGINKHIEFAINLMQSDLWDGFNNDYNGRSFRIRRDGAIKPEIYKGNNEYNEVFTSDKVDSIVHFDLDPTRTVISKTQVNAGVNIIFAVNIGKIYGSNTRAVEEAHNDVINVINNTAFEITDIVTGVTALADYDLSEEMEHKFDMQPYYVFKLECTCTYSLKAVCDPIIPKQYSLTVASTSGGTVLPFEGTKKLNVGDIFDYYAEADENSVLDKIVVNNVENNKNPNHVVANRNNDIFAYFISSVIAIQDVFGTVPKIKNSAPYFLNQITEQPNKEIKIVFFGNSIIEQDLDLFIKSALARDGDYYNFEVVNEGLGGRQGNQMIGLYDTLIAPLFDPTKDCYLFTFEFINDLLSGGQTVQQAYDNMVAVYDKGTSTGFKVIAPTATGTATTLDPLNANIQAANDLLRANHSMVYYYFDVWDRVELTNPNATSIFYDGIHFTDEGKLIYSWNFSYLYYKDIALYPDITNAVKIKNVLVGNFDNNFHLNNGVYLTGGDSVKLKIKFTVGALGRPQALFSCGGYNASNVGLAVQIDSSNNMVIASTTQGSVTSKAIIKTGLQSGDYIGFLLDWGGAINEDAIYSLNDQTYVLKDIWGWAGNSATPIDIGTYVQNAGLRFEGLIHEIELDNYFKYSFQESTPYVAIDGSGLGNDATIIGDASSMYDIRSDKTSAPLETYGYTLFQSQTEPLEFIQALYDINGNKTKTSIAGYNFVREVERYVVSDVGELFDGVLALSGTNNTFEEIHNLENSSTVEIEKDDKSVSRLIVKQ